MPRRRKRPTSRDLISSYVPYDIDKQNVPNRVYIQGLLPNNIRESTTKNKIHITPLNVSNFYFHEEDIKFILRKPSIAHKEF
jgi:hypothetical protein